MSKILFTDKQVKELSKNEWIKKVSNKAITYTDEFKIKLLKETENYKKIPQDIFRDCGIDPNSDFELILKAYKFKNRKKGSRQIKTVLENEFVTVMNLKKIED